MKALVVTGVGGPEVLAMQERPTPRAVGADVLVRVRAFGVNRADLLQTRGQYPAPAGVPADVPGLEYAGEVAEVGSDATGSLRPGDRVFGIVGGGAYAEYLVTHERMAVPIPANLDFVQAAAVPEVFLTAFDALETQGRVQPGERVLIHAVGGGVGSAALQLAHMMGCTTFGTARSAWKLEQAQALGLDHGIDTSAADFASEIRERTGGAGVHAIIDHLGAPALAANLACLAVRGRLVVVGLLGGASAQVDLGQLLKRRLTVIGTALRSRPIEEKIELTQRFASRVIPWLANGRVRPVVDQVFSWNDVRAAHERVASNLGFGKVVMRVDG